MEKRELEVRSFNNTEALSSALADYILQISETAAMERGSFSLALPGGDVAKRLSKLTSPAYLKMGEPNWSRWHVFWAEENVVADKKHPNSLYRQANEAFISKVPILPEHVISVSHGIGGDKAANKYEFSIRQKVRKRTVAVSPSNDCPRFDLIILTPDHIACLPTLDDDDEDQWVAYVKSPKERVTLTLPVINAAANVAIVTSGFNLSPVQMVSPKDGKLVWFVDTSATSM